MPFDEKTFLQAILNSQNARLRGDKLAARHWAADAAAMAPEREEPWLLLAALASPQASVGYLQHALKANPGSSRARAGMIWALRRARAFEKTAKMAPVPAGLVSGAIPAAGRMRSRRARRGGQNSSYWLLLPVVLLVILSVVALRTSSVTAFFSAPQASQSPVSAPLAQAAPTEITAEITAEAPTSAPTSTLIPPTAAPATATATIENTPTALPTDSGPASVYQAQANQAAIPPYNGSKKIVVSISEQHMYVYDGDNLVFSFVASTGMDNATRTGSFAVLDKIPNAYGSTWDLWMPNWLGIYYSGNIENGIHALPILHSGATLWAGFLGTPISYGCVVLSTFDSQLLYDWVDLGTPVIIQR